MNDLLKEKIFSLLSESFYVTNEEMQKAYEDFLTRIEKLNQSESDYLNFFRVLNLTRIEFYSLGSLSFYEQGEKCT